MCGERARRVRRAWVVVCCLFLVAWATLARSASAEERVKPARADARDRSPIVLGAAGASPGLVAYPPRSGAGARPVTVMLHGMCGTAEGTCAWLAEAATRDEWLVCPRAPVACGNGGATWTYASAPSLVEASIARVAALRPGEVDAAAPRTLMGFSLGASVALDLAQHGQGKWARLVLIAADVSPDARALERAGVRRVLMGAGDYDMMKPRMMLASERLQRAGVASTFV